MRTLAIYLAIAIIALSTSVNAAIYQYDFAQQGIHKEYGYSSFNTATDVDSTMGSLPGISISASDGSSNQYWAYFDGPYGQDAGLGVCQLGSGSACAGNSDDNQMPGEYIHMVFGAQTNILSLDITGITPR